MKKAGPLRSLIGMSGRVTSMIIIFYQDVLLKDTPYHHGFLCIDLLSPTAIK